MNHYEITDFETNRNKYGLLEIKVTFNEMYNEQIYSENCSDTFEHHKRFGFKPTENECKRNGITDPTNFEWVEYRDANHDLYLMALVELNSDGEEIRVLNIEELQQV